MGVGDEEPRRAKILSIGFDRPSDSNLTSARAGEFDEPDGESGGAITCVFV